MKSSEASRLLLNCQFPSKDEYLARIQDALAATTLTHVVTLNAEMVVEAERNKEFKQAVEKTELVIPDGSSILWARNYLRQKQSLIISLIAHLFSHEQPLTGVDSIFDICELVQNVQGRVYLLGGTNEQAQGTLRVLQKRYPSLTVRITEGDIPTDSAPSALFVAYGAPKQTLWIEERRTALEQSGVRIAVGVGGAFAILSGILPRAPRLMRRFHLEWLWRLVLEPKRIRRIWNAVVVFPTLIQKKTSSISSWL